MSVLLVTLIGAIVETPRHLDEREFGEVAVAFAIDGKRAEPGQHEIPEERFELLAFNEAAEWVVTSLHMGDLIYATGEVHGEAEGERVWVHDLSLLRLGRHSPRPRQRREFQESSGKVNG